MLQGIKASLFNLSILGAIATLTGCSYTHKVALAQEKPTIVASHNIICDLVTTIAEDTIDLNCLIDAAQDPHTYRPSPAQRKAMEQAQLIIYGGYELEPKISKLLETAESEEAERPTPKIALYEEVVAEPIRLEEEDNAEAETTKPSPNKTKELAADPHIWHNVEHMVAMVELIQPILLQLNPIDAGLYLQNSTALVDRLWQLDSWIKEQVATIPPEQKVLVTTHDSLNYYIAAYGFEDYKTLQGISSESSPTASRLRTLATEIKQIGVPTIFAESTASDRVIRNVARAAKVKLADQKLFADGLGEADNYVEMMVSNTCTIVDGLGGECRPFE